MEKRARERESRAERAENGSDTPRAERRTVRVSDVLQACCCAELMLCCLLQVAPTLCSLGGLCLDALTRWWSGAAQDPMRCSER